MEERFGCMDEIRERKERRGKAASIGRGFPLCHMEKGEKRIISPVKPDIGLYTSVMQFSRFCRAN